MIHGVLSFDKTRRIRSKSLRSISSEMEIEGETMSIAPHFQIRFQFEIFPINLGSLTVLTHFLNPYLWPTTVRLAADSPQEDKCRNSK